MKNVLNALKQVVSRHPLLSTVLLVTALFLLMSMCSGCNDSSSGTTPGVPVVDGYYLISEGTGNYSDSDGQTATQDIAGYYFTVSQMKDAVVVLGFLSKIDSDGNVSFEETVMNSYGMWGPIITTVSGSASFDGESMSLSATSSDYYNMLDYTVTSEYTLKADLDTSVLEPTSGG